MNIGVDFSTQMATSRADRNNCDATVLTATPTQLPVSKYHDTLTFLHHSAALTHFLFLQPIQCLTTKHDTNNNFACYNIDTPHTHPCSHS